MNSSIQSILYGSNLLFWLPGSANAQKKKQVSTLIILLVLPRWLIEPSKPRKLSKLRAKVLPPR